MVHIRGEKNMHNLVPKFIRDKQAAGQTNGRFHGVVLFVDTSGFTALSARLMAYGKEGAEILAQVLTAVFDPLVHSVYANGGFIAGFAGDAFKAVFPDLSSESYLRTVQAAQQIKQFMAGNDSYSTPYGAFNLAVRASIAAGEITWGIWSVDADAALNQSAVYTFGGEAIDTAVSGEDFAEAGDTVVTQAVIDVLGDLCDLTAVPLTGLAEGYWRVTAVSANFPPALPMQTVTTDAVEQSRRFFPMDLLLQPLQGEFRHVYALFVNVQQLPQAGEADNFMSPFLRLLHQYGGYLCRIGRIGAHDSGGTFLLFWGAPTAHENDTERILSFLLDLRAKTAVPFRAGLTYNIVYAGFIGSVVREEYTCYGLSVNLAARLLSVTQWGDIWLDESAANRVPANYEIAYVDSMAFKGVAQPQPVFELLGYKQDTAETFFQRNMVGRQQELRQIDSLLQPLRNGRFAGIITIQGEAGIGKSRLIYEYFEKSDILDAADQLLCQTDEILREPLNPFRYLLRQYFEQSSTLDETTNKARFEKLMNALVAETNDPILRAELERTASFLGALIGLHWKASLYSQVSPGLRQENSFTALKTLIKAESLRRPHILLLEDAHWLDKTSLEFLAYLIRDVGDYPFAVVATTRDGFGDEELDKILSATIPHALITLRKLDDNDIAVLAESLLNAQISSALLTLLAARSEGNPFFVEQIVLYLQEQGVLIAGKDGIEAKGAHANLPADVQLVLVARLDRLAQAVKHVVQTAAVLGREFEVRVLSQMLRTETAVMDKVQTATDLAIWSALNEISYLFKHALLRDAAYEMQLQGHLRQLHRLAGTTIETLYQQDLSPRYADLAYHFGRAGDLDQERHYSRLAGEQAVAQYANEEAVAYFTRALELTPDNDIEAQFDLLLMREGAYSPLGKRKDQWRDLTRARDLIPKMDLSAKESALRMGAVAKQQTIFSEVTSDYPATIKFAQETIEQARIAEDFELEGSAYMRWTVALWRQGQYAEARKLALHLLNFTRTHGLRRIEGHALVQMGNTGWFLGEFEQCTEYYRQAAIIYKEIGHMKGEISTVSNLGLVRRSVGDYDGAAVYFQQSYAMHSKIGSRRGSAQILSRMGSLARYKGNFTEAFGLYFSALPVLRDVGDPNSEAMVNTDLGVLYGDLGAYETALTYNKAALETAINLGNRRTQSLNLITRGFIAHLRGNDANAQIDLQAALTLIDEMGLRSEKALALTFWGHVLLASGNLVNAQTSYQEALNIRQELKENNSIVEDIAGLTAVAYAHRDMPTAMNYVETVLQILKNHDLLGMEEPGRVFLTCYQVLYTQQDPRAAALLETAYKFLQKRAAAITDEQLRTSFLASVAIHREIIRLFEAASHTAVPIE